MTAEQLQAAYDNRQGEQKAKNAPADAPNGGVDALFFDAVAQGGDDRLAENLAAPLNPHAGVCPC